MKGSFEDREKGFEAKWAHDEDLRFRTTARRNKLLGHWAAEQMGLSGAAAESYVNVLLDLEVRGARDSEMLAKIHTDLEARNSALSEHVIARKMEELLAEAAGQIMSEPHA
jgi:hypothetical protein